MYLELLEMYLLDVVASGRELERIGMKEELEESCEVDKLWRSRGSW